MLYSSRPGASGDAVHIFVIVVGGLLSDFNAAVVDWFLQVGVSSLDFIY